MTVLYDAPADEVIEALTDRLEAEDAVAEPDWLAFVTSGVDRELPPEQERFWPRRAASLLRKVAIEGPIGVGSLESIYGGAKQGSTRYRVRPRHTAKGSGSVIRTALQQLEEAGYVEVAEGEGRQVTPAGQSLLDEVAREAIEAAEADLERYA
ncbi:30S ribosomal protein S19e [Halobacteriales archaeon QH_10_67_13]|nr:MAG: 30S ribosomal protein S19e [Halobacteriales archaeon QH_10_67_13]